MAGIGKSLPGMNTTLIMGGAAAKTTTSDPSAINTGEIAVFLDNGQNTRATESNVTSATGIIIKYKDNLGNIHTTDSIPASARVRAFQYRAEQEQIDYLGFNGSTGSITLTNEFTYKFNVILRETIESSRDGRGYPNYPAYYVSDASATQVEVAKGLLTSFLSSITPKHNTKFIIAELMMANGSDAAVATGADDFTFTNGSKVVSVTDVDNATGGAALVAGAFLRIGTAATDVVYEIASVDATANTLVLTIPYKGATATIADTGLKQISAANAATLACGIKLSGLAQDDWRLDRIAYRKTHFETLDESGKLGVTNSQVASKGAGTYKEIAELELFMASADGSEDSLRTSVPYEYERSKVATEALTVDGYDIWNIHWVSETVPGFVAAKADKHVYVIVPTDRGNDAVYADSGATDDISDVLEAYFTTINAVDTNGAALSSNKLEGTA